MGVLKVVYRCPYCGAVIAEKFVSGSAEQVFVYGCEHYRCFKVGNVCFECLLYGAKRCELYEKPPTKCIKLAKLLGKAVKFHNGTATYICIGPEPIIEERYIRGK